MASYCPNCGAEVVGRFCMKCGTPAPAAAPKAASSEPVVAKRYSGGPMRLLLVCALLGLLGAVMYAGLTFGLRKIRDGMAAFTEGNDGPAAGNTALLRGSACDLLSAEDVQRVLGVLIERSAPITERGESGCAYYTAAEAFSALSEQAMREAKAGLDREKNLAEADRAKELEGTVRTLALSKASEDGRIFWFTVNPDFGRDNWSTARLGVSVLPGFDELQGIGDRAMVGSFGHAMYLLKGDNMVLLNLIFVPRARTRGAELGRKIAAGI